MSEYSLRYNTSLRELDYSENFYNGSGYTRGIEFLAQKKFGKINGWISYTLGEARNQFDIYGDDDFPAYQDVNHEFKAVGLYKNFKTEIRTLSTTLLKAFTNIGLNLLEITIAAILSSFILVYSNSLVSLFKKTFIRVNNEKGAEIFNLVGMTIQNIAIGVIGVASVQAIIAAIGFIIIGIPAPGILALLVLFFSSIQIGPGVVIIPTIIYAWFTFDFTPSLIYTIWSIPVMLFDNILKPIVMSRGLATPMILIIIGLIGGTLLHGLIGLFIGPIILGVAYQLYRVWINES